jgi:hypothetical protein
MRDVGTRRDDEHSSGALGLWCASRLPLEYKLTDAMSKLVLKRLAKRVGIDPALG